MYYTGRGVPKDYKLAIKWFTKAAEQGLADAQSMVGVCYADGLPYTKNSIEGFVWYNIAIANGDEDAKEWIKEIELSPEQLIEAGIYQRKFTSGLRRTKRTNPLQPEPR